MNFSLALKLYAMIKVGIIKSNAHFWRELTKEKIENFEFDTAQIEEELKAKNIKLVCAFDDYFPKLDFKMKNSERPFLFLCKGDISLLEQTKNNVAVIGVLSPTKDIEKREQKIVKKLVSNKLNIVSGLALGCDSIAHKTCLENGGKTIAILPTTFDSIYPKENAKLVEKIVESGGLVITEYINEPQNRFERIKRFIERDRLQAMLSKAVLLIASFRQGQGDSGSRHAMQKAKEYGKQRFVMFNEKTDTNQAIFGLNQDLLRESTDRLNTKIQAHSTSQESEEQEKSNGKNPTLTEIEHAQNVEIPTPQNIEKVNERPTISEMPNQEDEDELTDEEIDRMIRALERKKKRKEKDFEM